jgi:ABC-type sugar transport system ATPase subunit
MNDVAASSAGAPASPPSSANRSAPAGGGADRLRVTGLSKSFGAVLALEDVSFEVARGEVMGIVGDNGAGKSTLIRCIAGIHRPDRGTIDVGAESFDALVPDTARKRGIEVVHQNLALVDSLDVVANLFLNRELLTRGPLGRVFKRLDRRRMSQEAAAALAEHGLKIANLRRPAGELSGGQRQMLAIIRAVLRAPDFVIMDEPTAALGVEQSKRVQGLALSLRDRGIGVIVVSHRMDQVMQITDRVIVLRHGRKAADLVTKQTDVEELVGYITGARGTYRYE